MKTQKLTRRSFLKTSGYGVSAFYIAKTSWAQSSPGDTIRAGVIGFRSRGQSHISSLSNLKHKGVTVAALCDVDAKVLDGGVKKLGNKNIKAKGYTDLRKMLEDKDLDVISIATPNHWHSLAAILAIQAGKDVYVEKPVSHNVWEGRQLVNAARKYKRIVQTGTQSRSSDGLQEAVRWIQAGNLGKIEIARGLCYKNRPSIGLTKGPHPVPENIDWDLWCGPGPLKPPMRNSSRFGPVHYDWHWTWDYGNGDLGNQGIHQMDIARWFLGEMELSPRVWSIGGRVGYKDDGETPNSQIVYHDYKNAPLIFEVRGLPESKTENKRPVYMGASVGVIIHCEGGDVSIPNYSGANVLDKNGKEIKKFTSKIQGNDAHFDNFITAVKSRKSEDLNAGILEGHLSSALCHTGNISYRLGSAANPDELRTFAKSEKGGQDVLARLIDHLSRNDVNIAKEKLTLGPALKMNPRTETFIGNKSADKLLTREYRKPFVVPKIV